MTPTPMFTWEEYRDACRELAVKRYHENKAAMKTDAACPECGAEILLTGSGIKNASGLMELVRCSGCKWTSSVVSEITRP